MMAFMTEVSSTAGANQTIPQNLLTYGKISSKKTLNCRGEKNTWLYLRKVQLE